MIGKTISHYKILEKLGEGGMGVVYKAEDTKLKRTVALKFLTPLLRDGEEKARFVHEAQAAAALDHPNICTVYEIDEADGQAFIAMAYVDGQSLKQKTELGPLRLDEALDIAIKVAEGLQEAHINGIVHRDIKSANIMVTLGGQVKIMDFGLAKLLGRTKLTKTGMTVGTAAYMAPEQAQGENVDHRTDIWSLGVVLYEMLTGQLPFKGDYEQAMLYSVINEEPEPVTGLRTGVPIELERVVNKALTKDPDERYQHCDELVADLKRLRKQLEAPEKAVPSKVAREKKAGIQKRKILIPAGLILTILTVFLAKRLLFTTAETGIDSIAVLPLESLSGDPEQEYFVDGMHDALIGELARIGALKVISRTSVMQYKKVYKPLPEIGRELNVGGIVEGTVAHSGDRIRINVQLIEVATDQHLWANDFESEMKDILLLQKEVAQAIANEIKITLTPQERTLLSSADLVDPQAHDMYLRAMGLWRTGTMKDRTHAKIYIEKAVEIDPNFARAYLGLASYYNQMHFYADLSAKEVFPKAKVAARKALELDESLGDAHAELGWALAVYDWDWQAAEKEYKRALQLNPGSYSIHASYGWVLSWMGRHVEAIYELKRAVELNPLSFSAMSNLSVVHTMARRFDEAIEIAKRAVSMAPEHSFPYLRLGDAYAAKGLYKKAINAYGKGDSLSGGSSLYKAGLGYSYGMAGQTDQALIILDELLQNQASYYYIASVCVGLHRKELALTYLEKAYDHTEGNLVVLKNEFVWDSLRDEPRFQDLIRHINFPERVY